MCVCVCVCVLPVLHNCIMLLEIHDFLCPICNQAHPVFAFLISIHCCADAKWHVYRTVTKSVGIIDDPG